MADELPMPPGPWLVEDSDGNPAGVDDGQGWQWVRHRHVCADPSVCEYCNREARDDDATG